MFIWLLNFLEVAIIFFFVDNITLK